MSEVSKLLAIPPDTILLWVRKGLVKSHTLDNTIFFDIDEINNLQSKILDKSIESKFSILKSGLSDYTSIDLFSGAGGLALGFENAGLNHRLLVELDKNASKTLKSNRPDWNVNHIDVSMVSFDEYVGGIDIVSGGFPCQSFSYAGTGRGFEDARGTLFFEFARAIRDIKPKIAFAENVRGLISHDKGRTLSIMINVLQSLGYNVAYKLVRSQFLDVPQKRERVFIVGTRSDLDIPILFPKEKGYVISLREALYNCPESPGIVYPLWKKGVMDRVPPGGNWRDLPIELQKEYMKTSFYSGGGKTGIARRLSWDEPSLTLTCHPSQKQTERCHPEETRPLTVREYARIQTFPDDWEFHGSMLSQYKQIGNAVPVNLSYHMGRALMSMLEGEWDHDLFDLISPMAVV